MKRVFEIFEETIGNYYRFQSLLAEKQVLLVGGSTLTDEVDLRSLYSSFFTVQLNHHLKRRPFQNCDYLIIRNESSVSFFNVTPDWMNEHFYSPKIISCSIDNPSFEKWHEFSEDIKALFLPLPGSFNSNRSHPFVLLFRQLNGELKTAPLLGLMAVKILLSTPLKSLLVTGFDFYRDINRSEEHTS